MIPKVSLFSRVGKLWCWLEDITSSFWVDIYKVITFFMACPDNIVMLLKLVNSII